MRANQTKIKLFLLAGAAACALASGNARAVDQDVVDAVVEELFAPAQGEGEVAPDAPFALPPDDMGFGPASGFDIPPFPPFGGPMAGGFDDGLDDGFDRGPGGGFAPPFPPPQQLAMGPGGGGPGGGGGFGGGWRGRMGGGQEGGPGAHLRELMQELNLTQAQRQKMFPILQKFRQTMQGLRPQGQGMGRGMGGGGRWGNGPGGAGPGGPGGAPPSPPSPEQIEKVKQAFEQLRKDLDPILTAPQKAVLKKHLDQMKERMGGPLANLMGQLGLSEAQKQKLTPILQEHHKKMQAMRQGKKAGEVEKPDFRQQMQKELRALRQKVEPILTPEQKKKLQTLMQQRLKGPGGEGGGPAQMLKQALAGLTLSAQQKQKLQALAQKHKQQTQALRQKMQTADPQQRHQLMRQNMDAFLKELSAILTPQQMEQFRQKMREGFMGHRGGGGKWGKGGHGGPGGWGPPPGEEGPMGF